MGLTAEQFDVDEMYIPISEEELQHALAESQADSHRSLEDGDEGEGAVKMLKEHFQFISGNVNIIRAESQDEAVKWMQSDPHQAVDGYAHTHVFRWLRSEDPELNVPRTDEAAYGVFCLDKEGQADLRAMTRSAHL